MSARSRTSQLWLAFGGVLVVLLAAAVFTLGSLNLPFELTHWNEVVVLYAVSTFIVAALLVFGLILARSLLRLWAERRAEQLGSRFKTKMVLGAMGISLLPVVFMFLISYALMNRTLSKWFPRPLEIATEESQKLLLELSRSEQERLNHIAHQAASGFVPSLGGRHGQKPSPAFAALFVGADAAWILDRDGKVRDSVAIGAIVANADGTRNIQIATPVPRLVRTLPSGIEVWRAGSTFFLTGRAPLKDAALVVGRRMPDDLLERYTQIETQAAMYRQQRQQLRTYRTQMLLVLLLFTVLLLFAATWFALFLSKLVTVPIQALAEATREVSHGNFDHRVSVQARDELGILVSSFNQMTAQLGASRRQIDEFTRSLQQAVTEIEQRRKLMEAILENIPTAVLSLDEVGAIVRTNPAVSEIFGAHARAARTLAELIGEPAARNVQQLMRKSLRMGAASKELEIALPGRVLHAAVTVSSLGPRRANPGFVVVVDDLTELLRAQKAAAWQEVAQRIAHEIRNPLTPIQLSAQRLARHLERPSAAGGLRADGDLEKLVGECASLIEREVAALKSLVDEFSEFARFPTAKPVPADLNAIVASALDVFNGRMEGVTVRTDLAGDLPVIKADPELLRRVLVNLIDNAAEAMESSGMKELSISTRVSPDGETVEVAVADTGHGISPEDKDRLFLPHFSTRGRGTGLGLAIASRIVAEHYGTIRAEDNLPMGARFVIRLPVAEVPATPLASGT